MTRNTFVFAGAAGLFLAMGAPSAAAQDWPAWGGGETKNMASTTKGLPGSFVAGDFKPGTDEVDLSTTENVKWVAKLGSQSYGNPTVSNGRIYVGTNNDSPRDPRFKGDRSTVYCLDEETGDFIWQLNVPKLGTGKVSDWEYLGICCSPSVDGDEVYIVTNRCEVMCLDVHGMANGNQGYQDEGLYMAWPAKEPMEVTETDADILWVFNMIDECGVFPHNITTSAVLVAGDNLWVTSSNGVDYGHVETPAPNAPSLLLFDKKTGELLGEEASGCSSRIFHSNWSSPAYLRKGETELCIFGGPDGWLYAFKPTPIEGPDEWPILDEAWRFDANLPEYRMKDGEPIKYTDRDGPSEVLATPIVYDGKVYAPIGQDPEHGPGVGNLVCVDHTGKQLWNYSKINRSLSTLAVADGLVFAADFSGFVYCIDANTGEEYWVHDTKGHIWASPFVADGKVYIGNEDGFLTILPASKEAKPKKEGKEDRPAEPMGEVVEIDMVSPVYASVIAANSVLYVGTHTHLYSVVVPDAAGQGGSDEDWPAWGGGETKNMASTTKGLPGSFVAGDFKSGTDEVDLSTTENVKWVAKLGSQSYGNPTVSNGRIYVGTNNDSPRDPRFKGDRSTVYCLDEETGDFIWQLNVPKLGTGKVSDWEYLGICCSPSVDGDEVYIVTNRCEVMCLDVHGMANGNQGYQDEGLYMAWPAKEPMEVTETDADILWVFNMIDECGVFPHNITTSAVLVAGDNLWVTSSNGVDYGHVETPAPNAPSLLLFDKKTGELLGEEASGCSSRIFHSNWSSPAYLRKGETELCIFGGPDGWLYAFKPTPIEGPDEWPILDEAWRFDANLPEYRMKDGEPIKYTDRDGPSEVLATPIVYDGKVYAPIGQDPEHGPGVGNLVCVDHTGKQLWNYSKINRSLSTLAVADGLVFAADFSGFVYCVDANTGEEYWVHDTKGHIWASPFVADGKVYIGNEDGFLTILPASKEAKPKKEGKEDRPAEPMGEVVEIDMVSPVYASVIAANSVLYVGTHTHLYAVVAPEVGGDGASDQEGR